MMETAAAMLDELNQRLAPLQVDNGILRARSVAQDAQIAAAHASASHAQGAVQPRAEATSARILAW